MPAFVDSGVADAEKNRQRIRSYAWVGFVVLTFLAIALVLALLGWQGPSIFTSDVAWVIGICLVALAFGLLYVLFTFRSTLRIVREQSVAIARLERRYFERKPAIADAMPETPSRPVALVEGIGPTYQARLKEIGIETLRDLRGADEERILAATGATQPSVHQWKLMANLLALDGVNAQAAELLVRAGVETVSQVAEADPTELHKELRRVNETRELRIHPRPLHMEDVTKWVNSARAAMSSQVQRDRRAVSGPQDVPA